MALLRLRALALLAAIALWPSLVSRPVWADDATEEPEEAVPFVVLNIASVDRALTDIAWMFDSIDRSDMKDVVGGLLSQAKDLKGVDRTRPFGQVVFLQTDALPPRPAFVFYVPVENLEEAIKTAMAAPVTIRKTVGREDEYEVLGEDSDGVEARIRVVGKYAYITPDEFADIFDVLPDMQPLTGALATKYDAALTVQMKAIPEGVRQVFVNFLRTQAEIDLQRKDEEPEAEYLVRRANGLSALEFIEQLVLQGEDLTIGWNAEPEKHSGYFELTLNATPDSEFAEYLSAVAAKPSMFTPLRDEERPLTINVSWVMNKREQTATTSLLEAAKVALSENLPDLGQPDGPIERMHAALQATCDQGHFDFFFQFAAADVQEFVLLGGLRLAGAQSFGGALEQFLQGVIVEIQKNAATGEGPAPAIVVNADTHQGVTIHKITPDEVRKEDERLYGGVPDFYIGTSSRVLWFGVGGNETLPTLHSSIDTLLTTPPAERAAGGNVPLSVTAKVAPWLELPVPNQLDEDEELTSTELTEEQERSKRRRLRRAQLARDSRAMAEEAFRTGDGLTIEGKPYESGFRIRLHLDEGFIKLLGLNITRGYDQSQL